MKIDILSDLHIDFYIKPNKNFTQSKAKNYLDKIFQVKQSNTLVVAGDLGHYNIQNFEIFEYIRANYYDNIICVLGNHDYYLLNSTQAKKYKHSSFNRVNEMREMLNSINGVYCLDGNVIELEGIRFGGCDSWYDGTYFNKLEHTLEQDLIPYWKEEMNDANKIYGIKNFYDLFAIESKKLKDIHQKCDVIITHVSPSIDNIDLPEYKQNKEITAFYSFDGEEYLKNTTAKYWIFGHMHRGIDYEREGVECITSALGYPGKNKECKVKTLEIKMETK